MAGEILCATGLPSRQMRRVEPEIFIEKTPFGLFTDTLTQENGKVKTEDLWTEKNDFCRKLKTELDYL